MSSHSPKRVSHLPESLFLHCVNVVVTHVQDGDAGDVAEGVGVEAGQTGTGQIQIFQRGRDLFKLAYKMK